VFTSARRPNTSARHAPNGDDLLLILAIFGDHTIESETAVIEHVRVTERDKGALCDFWNKSNVAPNRECKKRDLSSYVKAAMCVCVQSCV